MNQPVVKGARRVTWAAVPVAALGLLVGCGGDDTQSLQGVMVLMDEDAPVDDWTDCEGEGGYSDFGPGMNVTVRNGEGTIIGSGATRSLTAEDVPEGESEEVLAGASSFSAAQQNAYLSDAGFGFGCTVAFELEVPDAEFYEIEVGRRGELSYSRSELEAMDWDVELTLGG